ncbi:MAG: endopeptidase La [Bdellovibrionaceae bacterium]|nr:endopeptidase La [Pseudobdellovibrionaceae bacterium]
MTETGIMVPEQGFPDHLMVLPVQSAAVFPTLVAPILVTEPRFIDTVEESLKKDKLIGILLTQDSKVDKKTKLDDLFKVGVIARVIKRLKMPDGSIHVLVQSLKRFRVVKPISEKKYIVVQAEYLSDEVEKSIELDAFTRSIISSVKKLADVNPFFTEEMKLALLNASGPEVVADIVASALSLDKKTSQLFLETLSVKKRFHLLLEHLQREQNVADVQKKIQDDVNSKINHMQRDFFLREQLKVIKKELGLEEEAKDKVSRIFSKKIEESLMPEEVKKLALQELEKFSTIPEQSPEHHVVRSYLETLVDLPWGIETEDQLDLRRALAILNRDHYGLEKVKNRILEFLAIRALKKEHEEDRKKGSIICLVGPPGVGKTSIGKSIAETLGRKFYRFSLGGMRDEAEIKGHRRTYVGAMPGKVIQAMKRAGSQNPVILLDEIDKLGQSYQGDPASALLEVLDPEQNSSFIDHYLDVPFDLSQVVFIATANSIDTIPDALLDRMEIIEIPGYTLEEKVKIAKKYVIPKVLKENSIDPHWVQIKAKTLKKLMSDYAREPGLRSLQRLIEKISRKIATQVVMQKQVSPRKKWKPIEVKESDLIQWLGPQRFYNELAERITCPGVVVGLAWTSMGGDILFIEARKVPGSGGLKLTGQMGDVMTESASIAWSYVKSRLVSESIFTEEDLKDLEIHLHIPSGGVPKDGPSAGITMATALYSLLSKQMTPQKLGMTGELSLIGKVLPVGGVKEKLLAAKRAGLKKVILPAQNEKDLFEIEPDSIKGLQLIFVSEINEVFDEVFGNKKKK